MPSNSKIVDDLDALISLAADGEGDFERIHELAVKLKSANRVIAHIENETRRDLVTYGRKQGSCEICGGLM